MKLVSYLNKTIEYSFYAIFFLVPLIFAGNTSELFEFNKMWLAFGLTIIIALAWFSKMTVQRKIVIQRTPLDIPIMLFLASQIISTIFSLDPHVSYWGYYSRFNGGLLSTITYIFLYYAFVSNLASIKFVKRLLGVTLISGLIVALWGFPSRFGYDPSCLVFRGNLDTSCWTDAFKPTVRVFSTLGQPAWFAAYMVALTPLAIAFFLKEKILKKKNLFLAVFFFALAALFYTSLIFSNTRADWFAFAIADVAFFGFLFWKKIVSKKLFLRYIIAFHIAFALCNFFFGMPLGSLDKFSLPKLMQQSAPPPPTAQAQPTQKPQPTPPPSAASALLQNPGGSDITDSGKIRLFVWQGAIDAWKASPIFGTGVETYAFAYYAHRPAAHNLTSEWDYLYNKAHNEYLNYLATTGIVGLGSYLLFIGLFIVVFFRFVVTKANHADNSINFTFSFGLFAGWISILISNFFGFSVVIINIFLFLFPAFVFVLCDILNANKKLVKEFGQAEQRNQLSPYQWTGIAVYSILALVILWGLLNYWIADVSYALGYNLDRAGQYQQAYPQLVKAVSAVGDEPVYKDELAINEATLAQALFMQKDINTASQLAKDAQAQSDQVVTNHPNNVVYWKDRVRVFYALAQADPQNQQADLTQALQAIQKANSLAPTDAKIAYNLGVLTAQSGDIKKGIDILKYTVSIKQDYKDAYFALGIFYHEVSIDKNGKVIDAQMHNSAIATYQYILDNLSPNDEQAKKALQVWESEK